MAALPLAFAGQGVMFSGAAFAWVLGIGLPLAILFVLWGLRKNMAAAKKLAPVTAPKNFTGWWGAKRFLTKTALILSVLGLTGLASMDPRGGMTDERVNFGGKDIVVTVDGSTSMVYAEDGRMERTRKELNEFISRLQGTDRVGLVFFAGKARTASPVSAEYSNFEFKINRPEVETRDIGAGSNLGDGVKYAAEHFEVLKKLGDRQRLMIVISDGDVPEADVEKAIAAALEHKVTVYVIGVGDPAGTKIKIPTEDGKGFEYQIDEKTGQPATTRLVEGPLRKLAERTGGAYFRSGGKTSIDAILKDVSALEKGQQGDTIKSPRPIGVYLLWPALMLLLLDSILKGKSFLRRPQNDAGEKKAAKDEKGKGSGSLGGPASFLGLALIPLGAWPQILPFAILATLAAGYLAYDHWTGGALTRRITETWQRWNGAVPKGVAKDLVHLYDLREADERRLSHFVAKWQQAKEPLRETMIDWAARDEALWRELLTAAYLSGASPETMDKILAALRRAGKTRMEPLTPVTERILARRADIGWLSHSDAVLRVEALEAIAASKPVPYEIPSLKAPQAPGLGARLKRWGTVGVLSLMIALTGVSSIGTIQFQAQQRQAAEASMRLFYAEDLVIFTDRYVDARIPEQVLPALKRWHESPRTAGGDLERALQILRESPDPKADNVLVAIVRRAGILPLTAQGEAIMLRSLIERDNDMLWASMDQIIAASRSDEGAAMLLVKLVVLGVESGNEKTIVQLFRVLKSPNRQVQQMAGGVLYSHLSRDGGKKFFDGITAVQDKHVNDPALQLWSASFVFRRLGDAAIQDGDLAKAKIFLDKSLAIARAYDALRKPIWEATPPDQEVKGPPSMVVMLLNIGDKMQGDGNAPAPLQGGVRYLITQAITEQIKEAEAAIPGLHERLIADGVVLPDSQSGGGYGDYYDDHGHGGYYGRGGSYTTKNYRELYKLGHLQAFAKALEEMGGPKAEPATKENAATRELMDRAMATVEKSLEAGAKAGMMQGGSAPELAADDLWETIKSGQSTFSGQHFMKAMRTLGLAPAMGDYSSRLAYAESLDAAQLATLRDALVVMAKENKGWESDGKTRPLTWAEKIWLSGAIEQVEAVRAARFPSEKALDASDEDSLLIAKLSRELTAKGDSAALDVETKLFAQVGRPGFDAADANALLKQILASVKGKPAESVAVDALTSVLKTPNGAAFAPAARERAGEGLKAAAEKAESAFAGLKTANLLVGARESEYAWRSDLKLRHYQSIIDGITEAENQARAAGKLTPEMKAAAETARKTISSYKALAALAGAPAGDSVGEIAADEANVVLLAGYRLFTASEFNEALRAAKLMPGAGNNLSDYRQTYTKAELEAIRAWLVKTAAGGKSLGSSPRDLTWNEKVFLTGAIDRFDEILAKRFGGPAATKGADLKTEVMRPGQESLALVRLTVALKARAKDAGFAVRAQDVLIEILKARPGHDSADVAQVLDLVSEAVAGTPSEKPQLEALLAGLKTPAGKLMAEAASERAAKGATEVGEELEKVLDKLKDANVNSGAREDDDSWREPFTLRHYRELRAASDSAMAKVKKPTAEQRKAFEKAKTLLPLYERIAAASGVAAGDDPAEISAELLNSRLQKGYTVFPGSTFTEKLRAMGLMDSNGAGYGSGEYREKYSKADVVKLKTWLEGIKKSGKGWEGDGTTPRDLTDAEAETIDEALRAADRALAAHEGKKTQHAFSPLMLAALPVLGAVPLLLFAAVGIGAAFVVWRMLSKAQAKEEEARLAAEAGRDTIEAKTLARHRRIELSARRLATAVSGGSFRSRFIGAGGTEFAEARPYENEDAREIDWKTSAKKDELYAKKFELERDMPLMLVVDVSKSGRVGTTGVEKRAAIQDAAAVIALAATRHNVRVGLILVSDRVETVIPPKGGQKHAMQLIEAILNAEAQGQTTDLKPGLDTAGKVLVSRSMVAVISDFISADFKDALGSLAARHDVRPIRVSDPAELQPLPDVGLLPVEDAETGTTRVLDTSSSEVRREQGALISRREQMIETAFEAARLRPIKISTEGDPLESLELALQPKAKQPKNP